uniref:Uncharacterized protein n=1 Tax=Arundo donax TaxID=35708 RepID=A0A0A9AAN1_ARUDO
MKFPTREYQLNISIQKQFNALCLHNISTCSEATKRRIYCNRSLL